MKRIVIAILFLLALPCSAQQIGQPANDWRGRSLTLELDAPRGVASATAQRSSGNPGLRTLYYWVVTQTAAGASIPAGPFSVSNAPDALSANATVGINWAHVAGAVSYDVLRTSTMTPPQGACNCAVATGVSGASATDQSELLVSYTVAPLDPASASLIFTNEANGLTIRRGGIPISLLPNLGTTVILGSIVPYVDFGAAIRGCLAQLPASGGTCDASGISGAQTLSTVDVPSNTTIYLPKEGNATLTVPGGNKGFTIAGKSHVRLYGGSLVISGLNSEGVAITGAADDVTVQGMTVIGDSIPASYQVGLLATDTAKNVTFQANRVLAIGGYGIACGTSRADTIRNCNILDNYISAIYGTGTGQGYGVLANSSAPAATLIQGNYIEKTQRHCIYAATGGGVRILANHLADHGYGLPGNVAAGGCIDVGRGPNSTVAQNLIERSGNNAIELFAGTLASGDLATKNLAVNGNIITDTAPGAGDIALMYPTDDTPTNVQILSNIISRPENNAGISAIAILAGKQVMVGLNTIVIPAAAGYGISATAAGEGAGTANYTSSLVLANNTVFTGGGSDVGIYLSDTFAGSGIDLNLLGNTVKATAPLYISGTQTNPNISSANSPLGNLSLALLKPFVVSNLTVGGAAGSYPLDVSGGARIQPQLTISGNANPYVMFDDGTHLHYLQVEDGKLNLSSPNPVRVSSSLEVTTGGAATKVVCWKADGITLGYATMTAGDISACN